MVKSTLIIFVLLFSAFSSYLVLDTHTVSADYIGGPITGTLDATEIHYVTSDLSVPEGGTLTITAGAKIIFEGNYEFDILGTLNVLGTAGNPVYFSSGQSSPAPGDWKGLVINAGTAILDYVVIEYADIAIHIINSSPQVTDCIIRKNNDAVLVEGSSSRPYFYRTVIHDHTNSAITMDSYSKMDFVESRLNNTVTISSFPALILKTMSTFYGTNSTIEFKFWFNTEQTGNSDAYFLNCNLNHNYSEFKFNDGNSKVFIRNYLHVHVATKTQAGEKALENVRIIVSDSGAVVWDRISDVNGDAKWMDVTYAVMDSIKAYYININVTVNYANIFTPYKLANMSTSHWEYIINDVPGFNFQDEYTILEDTKNDHLIDLWEAIDDDYYSDEDIVKSLELNTGEDIEGKLISKVKIVENRYLSVDVSTGDDNDNWTGTFYFSINVTDPLCKQFGIYNISDNIPIKVTPVNDPPAWYNMSIIHITEDTRFPNALDFNEHVVDCDTDMDLLTFSVKDFDKMNYDIDVDDNILNISFKETNIVTPTNVTFCAYDGDAWGNFTTMIVVDPEPDAPVINRTLADFDFDEDTTYIYPGSLHEVFQDPDGDMLTFSSDSDEYIKVNIDQVTGNITFQPVRDWFGEQVITFHANDSIYNVSHTVMVTVNGINDPPGKSEILSPAGTGVHAYRKSELIRFTAFAYDPDISLPGLDSKYITDSLTYTWESNISGLLNIQDNFTKGLPEGHHNITLTVEDSKGLTSRTWLEVFVFGEFRKPEVWHKWPLPEYYTVTENVRLEWNVSADPDTLQYIRYDVVLDIMNPPKSVVARNITTTYYMTSGLYNGKTYYWTIVPYLSQQPGVDKSGIWEFTYENCQQDCPQIYKVSLDVTPKDIKILQGGTGTLDITITNKGNMPDLYRITITVEKIIEQMFDRTTYDIYGLNNGLYGMQSNEVENVIVTISVLDDFKMTGYYDITIKVESLSQDESDIEIVEFTIIEKPEPKPPGKITEGGYLLYIILLLVIVIIAVIAVLYAYHRRGEETEEEGEDDEEVEGEPRDDIMDTDEWVPPSGGETENVERETLTPAVETENIEPGTYTSQREAKGDSRETVIDDIDTVQVDGADRDVQNTTNS